MLQAFKFLFTAMTVPCELILYESQFTTAQALAQQIIGRTKALENKYNFHNPDSWLNQTINQRSDQQVTLDEECTAILKQVRQLSVMTNGLFDITVGSLSHAAKSQPNKPLHELKTELQSAMGINSWHLDKHTLLFNDPRSCLDLGGVIKEFAVDEAGKIAQQASGGSLISFGGDMRINGRKPDETPFHIGVRDPENKDQLLLSIAVEDASVATSGNYERKTRFANEDKEHIIATTTESVSDILSSTVIAEDTLTAGIYSTALMLNPATALPDDIQQILVGKGQKIYSNVAG
jgi:thiamine biosynthesis lipoprotein